MDERVERIGKNEAIFREANEQLEQLNRTFASGDTMRLICECAKTDCTEDALISLPEYRELRSDPTLFAVKPGHDAPGVEDVVSKCETYWVVKKRSGGPAEVAESLDPRSS